MYKTKAKSMFFFLTGSLDEQSGHWVTSRFGSQVICTATVNTEKFMTKSIIMDF